MTRKEQLCYANGIADTINLGLNSYTKKTAIQFMDHVIESANLLLTSKEITSIKFVKHSRRAKIIITNFFL